MSFRDVKEHGAAKSDDKIPLEKKATSKGSIRFRVCLAVVYESYHP